MIKFCDLKRAEFRVIMGAEESVRLAPTDDDKPKSAEIMPFQASSDTTLLLNRTEKRKPRLSPNNFLAKALKTGCLTFS